MMETASEPALAAARFGARQRKGVLLGFTGPRLTVIGVAALLITTGLFTAGVSGALLASPLVTLLLAAAFVPIGGKVAVEWAPVAGHWGLRRLLRQDVYGVRPLAPRPVGTLALPGDAAAIRVHVDGTTGTAMLHDRHRQTLSATCLVTHPAFVLLGADDQNRRVTGWGRVLAGLARSGHISAVQVMETTMPDSGNAVREWWSTNGVHDDTWAAETYGAFIAAAAPSSALHRTTITVSLDLRRANRAVNRAGRGLAGAAAVLRADMASLQTALRAAELRPEHWLNEAQVADAVRAAYDPDGATIRNGAATESRASSAGPVGMREHWSWLESDNSVSAVLWVSEWPRSQAYPNFLSALVLAPDVRKSFSLVARPVPAAEARKDIRRQKVEYLTDADQKARIGQVADLSDAAELQDVLDREQELAVGHADFRFAGLIAVTASNKDDLDAAVSQIEQAAIQCECETRLLVGQQSQAFAAAAVPLGRGL